MRKKAGKTHHDRVKEVTSRRGGVIAAKLSGHCNSGKMSHCHDRVRGWQSEPHADRRSECRPLFGKGPGVVAGFARFVL